jgi:hypothetical protein
MQTGAPSILIRAGNVPSLERAAQYIYGKGKNQLFQDTRWTVNTVFAHEHIKGDLKFRFFIPEYFQFFNNAGNDQDWCIG